MNLLNLAPDIQEAILFLPRTFHGRDPIHLRPGCGRGRFTQGVGVRMLHSRDPIQLRQLQPIASTPDWRKQRRMT